MSEVAPRVDEIFSRALEAQLAEQQAQRDAFGEIDRRLAEIERVVGESLVAVQNATPPAGVGTATSSELFHERMSGIERALGEGLASLRNEVLESTERRLQAIEDTIGTRLVAMEGSVRKLQEETHDRLDDLRDTHLAAEAGILERIIAESQVVGAVFEAVRPAVEAAAQVGPELENTLEELRQIVEDVQATTDGSESPYSADELNAPHEDAEEHQDLFLPPEETPIPDRRFGILPRRDR